MTICSSILACRIPWTEEPAGLQSKGLHRIGHDWKTKHRSMKRNKTLVWVSELAWKITYRIVSISFYFVFHIYLFFFRAFEKFHILFTRTLWAFLCFVVYFGKMLSWFLLKETKRKIWRTDLRRYQYYCTTIYSPEEGESWEGNTVMRKILKLVGSFLF